MVPFGGTDWLALTQEPTLEPEMPICDPHHHFWDFRTERIPYQRYLLHELSADIHSGHNVRSTVFIEARAMYRADGPEEMRPVGEVEFVQGLAAASASGLYGPGRAAAAIVGHANLNLGQGVAPVLEALRAAVDDPAAVPNGRMHDAIGSCLVYAIYHSPLAFIRTLLEAGADPRVPADHGFPPLIAALVCGRSEPGATRRTDVDEIIRVLLASGADPNQRGINDYTALHMAVAERNALAVDLLLDGGADPDIRTRIDDCETPAEMARSAGLTDIAALLEPTWSDAVDHSGKHGIDARSSFWCPACQRM